MPQPDPVVVPTPAPPLEVFNPVFKQPPAPFPGTVMPAPGGAPGAPGGPPPSQPTPPGGPPPPTTPTPPTVPAPGSPGNPRGNDPGGGGGGGGFWPPAPDFWPPAPDYSPGGPRGDPHIATLDGLTYDFQTVGEFEVAAADEYGLEIQARFVPLGPRVSLVRAVAFTLSGHEIEIGQGRPIVPDRNHAR